jgi:hypothetical protein
MSKIIFIKTRRYSTLINRIFEEYKENVEIYVERHRYTEKDIPELVNWWCTNRIIKRTIDFTLKRDGVELFGFHDTPDQFWAAMSEQPFVEGLAKEKIVRYRVSLQKPRRSLHKSLCKLVTTLFSAKGKGEI